MHLIENPAEFILHIDGVALIEPCISLTFYLDRTRDESLFDFYERSCQALGSNLTHVLADGADRSTVITKRSLTLVPTWIRKPRAFKKYFILFSGAEIERGVSPASLMMFFEPLPEHAYTEQQQQQRRANARLRYEREPGTRELPLSHLRVTFPLNHEFGDPVRLLSWISDLKIVRDGPLVSGTCGLALNVFEDVGSGTLRDAMNRTTTSLMRRHPGLDWKLNATRDLLPFSPDIDDFLPLIPRVNWLTFVSNTSLRRISGTERSASQLANDPSIVVHDFPWGIMVQAGPAPKTGNLGRGDDLPIYRAVAAALRPIRVPALPDARLSFPEEATEEWLEALDRPATK